MEIRPILSALRRNKSGALLIGLQIALTLTIVCNSLFIVAQRLAFLSVKSGVDEAELVMIGNLWVGAHDADAGKRAAADLETIFQTPGVVDAYRSDSFPFQGAGTRRRPTLSPDQKQGARTAIYFSDSHTIRTLGTQLIAGRDFRPEEIGDFAPQDVLQPPVVIITAAMAGRLFPGESALGKALYLTPVSSPSVVIGVVDRLHVPWNGSGSSDPGLMSSMLVPLRQLENGDYFIVRTVPGQAKPVLKALVARLYASDHLRVVTSQQTFNEARARAYRKDLGLAIQLGIVCTTLLLAVTAGIIGLVSFWVDQRYRQIGIRRALGARRADILSYFMLENLLLVSAGVMVGGVLSVSLNIWLVNAFEMSRMSATYVLSGALVLLVLGQLATFLPARRASHVSPAVAIRAV